jgi:hypothetical protein
MTETKGILSELVKTGQEMRKEISDIRVILERNTVSLVEHIKRTEIAEERIDNLEEFHKACPARRKEDASKYLWKQIRDVSIFIGLLVLIFKEFLPMLKEVVTKP